MSIRTNRTPWVSGRLSWASATGGSVAPNKSGELKMSDDVRIPTNVNDARAALSMKRPGLPPRIVRWRHFDTRETNPAFPINVTPGNELTIHVESGSPKLILETGAATVVFISSWGTGLTIQPGSSARVIVPNRDTKVTIYNDGDLTLEAPDGKNRILILREGTVQFKATT